MVLLGETAATVRALLHDVAAPLLLGQGLPSARAFGPRLEAALGHAREVKFAVEQALVDLQAKLLGVPAYVLLGGLVRREVPVMRMIGIKPPADTAREVVALAERGHRYAKLKVGLDVERDVEAVRQVRAAVGPGFHLLVDGNGGFAPKAAIAFVRRIEEYGVYLVEQPVRADDLRGMALVRQAIRPELMADEGILTAGDALRWIEAGAADAVSLKLWKQGSLSESERIAAVCAATNTRCHVGTTASSRLHEAAQATFVACQPEITDGAEIAEFEDFAGDPAHGVDVVDGAIRVSDAPGWGVEVDTSGLEVTARSEVE
jgi:L-alanine-DL-glutamate epimerase-like enolase superfamily enzyme